MSTEKIVAEPRTEFGKGAARRLRREKKIPAVIYGHGQEPQHLALPEHATKMALRHGGPNAVLELVIDGTPQLALTKQIQVEPIRRVLEHVDFVAVKRGEKVTVDVPVVVVGEAGPDTLVVTDSATVQVEVEATHIPEQIEVSVEGLEAGTQVLASQVTLPAGATLLTEAETLVVNVTQQISAEALEAELEEAEAEAGIERDPSDEEVAEAASGDAEESTDSE